VQISGNVIIECVGLGASVAGVIASSISAAVGLAPYRKRASRKGLWGEENGNPCQETPSASAVSAPHQFAQLSPPAAQQRGAQRLVRVAQAGLDMTHAEQEADLIERGLPAALVRSGKLDYASLRSGSFAERIRNGYA
jgi:hypothetical protein